MSDDILSRIKTSETNFQTFNKTKLNNLYNSIGKPELVSLFDYIPFLLHYNMPEFPGYIKSLDLPKGIYGYRPSNNLMSYIRKNHPSVILPKEAGKTFIQMFALMGSGGTIAFTNQSDFDFWICANESEASHDLLKLFKLKCKMIEEWIAENHNIEVHFFLNDISKVKKNIFDEDEEIGMGGASLGQLLKEEFLRSSIVIAGKVPFWWVVPTDCSNDEYNEWLETANKSGYGSKFIDIGNLSDINREEFLIAALFQILKSIGNPFKSIIKLGLLEKYLQKDITNPYISTLIKGKVQEGKTDPLSTDAYLVMFNQVYEYYSSQNSDTASLNLLKTCFYLKVDPKLSIDNSDEEASLKSEVMSSIVKDWGWDKSTILHVDGFESWDIDTTHRLLTNTKKYILNGYKKILTSIQSDKAMADIQGETIKIISHKIYSHFLPAENKIDNTLSLKNYPPVKFLQIEFIRDKDNKEYWILSKKQIEASSTAKIIIHKNKSLFAMVVWISLNGLFKKDFTRLDIEAGLHVFDPNYIRELINELSTHFSFKKLEQKTSYFLTDAFPEINYIIVNPFSKYAETIDEIFFLYHNSWGETRFQIFRRPEMIPEIISRIVNGGLKTGMGSSSSLRLSSSYPFQAKKEFKALKKTALDIYSYYVDKVSNKKSRYITMFGNKYFLFSSRKSGDDIIVYSQPCETELKLLYSIAYNRGTPNRIGIDPSLAELNYLKKIIENYREDSIQIYFQIDKKYTFIYISDERGSIIFYRKSTDHSVDYISGMYNFADNVIKTVLEHNPTSPLAGSEKSIILYKMERDIKHNCTINEIVFEDDTGLVNARKKIIPFKLSLHLMENGDFGYSFSLPDGRDTEIFNRNDIEEIAKELKVVLSSVPGYNYFVTDINLEHSGMNMYKMYTSLAFSEKNRFEMLIEKGMKLIKIK